MKAGEKVIVGGLQMIRPGMAVQPKMAGKDPSGTPSSPSAEEKSSKNDGKSGKATHTEAEKGKTEPSRAKK